MNREYLYYCIEVAAPGVKNRGVVEPKNCSYINLFEITQSPVNLAGEKQPELGKKTKTLIHHENAFIL